MGHPLAHPGYTPWHTPAPWYTPSQEQSLRTSCEWATPWVHPLGHPLDTRLVHPWGHPRGPHGRTSCHQRKEKVGTERMPCCCCRAVVSHTSLLSLPHLTLGDCEVPGGGVRRLILKSCGSPLEAVGSLGPGVPGGVVRRLTLRGCGVPGVAAGVLQERGGHSGSQGGQGRD